MCRILSCSASVTIHRQLIHLFLAHFEFTITFVCDYSMGHLASLLMLKALALLGDPV